MMDCLDVLAPLKPEILILGSFPGEESLKQQMYYAHKSNRFFKVLFKIFDAEYSLDNNLRKKLIENNNIALFDVIKSCDRVSSADSKIKNIVLNDIDGILIKYPSIKKIILNGKKAGKVYYDNFPHIKVKAVVLPSTSPANAAFSFEKLYDIYKTEILKIN